MQGNGQRPLPMPQDALAIKGRLGIVSQFDSLDPDFSCAENLLVFGRYFRLKDAVIQERIPKLLEFAALTHKANARLGELWACRTGCHSPPPWNRFDPCSWANGRRMACNIWRCW